MPERIALDDYIAVELAQPTAERVEALARDGIRALINLRQEGEAAELSPVREGEVARGRGLAYLHLPVNPSGFGPKEAARFSQEVTLLPTPVVVHCASGRRASLLSLAHVARKNGWPLDQAIARAAALDLPLGEDGGRKLGVLLSGAGAVQ